MSITWFKFPHDLPDRLDIQALPIEHKWAWVILQCQASKNLEQRGVVEGLEEDVAHICGFRNVQDYQYFLDKLRQRGLIESMATGKIKLANWEKEQHVFQSDRTEATRERKRKSRQKQREKAAERPKDVTSVTNVTSRVVTPESHQKPGKTASVTSHDERDVTPMSQVSRQVTTSHEDVTSQSRIYQSLESAYQSEFQEPEKGCHEDVTTSHESSRVSHDTDKDLDLDTDSDPDPEEERYRSSVHSVSLPVSHGSTGVTHGESSTGVIYPEVLAPSLFPEESYTTPPPAAPPSQPNQRLRVMDGGKPVDKPAKQKTIPYREAVERLQAIYNEHCPGTWAKWSVINADRVKWWEPILKAHGFRKTCEMLEGALRWVNQDKWWGAGQNAKFNIDTLIGPKKNRLVQFYESWQGITDDDGNFNALAGTESLTLRLAQKLHRRLAAIDEQEALEAKAQSSNF